MRSDGLISFGWYAFISTFFLAIILVLRALSTGLYDAGDAVAHFQIAKFAGAHPQLFLDHWGKPIFTLFSHPFTYMGLFGQSVFNALCAFISLMFAGELIWKRNKAIALFLPLILLTSPEFVRAIMAGTTEPLFATLAIVCIWSILKEKYGLAAFIAGALPFTRPEFIGFVPILLLVFAIQQKWRPMLWLAFIPLVYTVIGAVVYGDPLWVINNDPYRDAKAIYGSGDGLHFVKNSMMILGGPGIIALLLGSFMLITNSRKKGMLSMLDRQVVALTLGSSLFIWLIHTLLWWSGTKGSLGLVRVLVTTVPLVGLFAIWMLSSPMIHIKNQWLVLIGVLSVSYGAYSLNQRLEMPMEQWYDQKFLEETAMSIKSLEHSGGRISMQDPTLTFLMDLDPFDTSQYIPNWWLDPSRSDLGTREGDLLIWDSHFSANEGRLPLDRLKNTVFFTKVGSYRPEVDLTTSLGALPMEVHVFQRKTQKAFLGRELMKNGRGFPSGMGKSTSDDVKNETELCFDNDEFPLTGVGVQRKNVGDDSALLHFTGSITAEGIRMVYEVRTGDDVIHYESQDIPLGPFALTLPMQKLGENVEERVYLWNRSGQEFCVLDSKYEFYQ